jgi:hypothetical protein
MSDSFFKPIITAAGQAAAAGASDVTFQIKIAEIGFGRGQYDTRLASGDPHPDALARTTLDDPDAVRVSVRGISPTPTNPNSVIIGTLGVGEPFPIGEIGFYLDDGTLFAVASTADKIFFNRSEFVPLPSIFTLRITQVPGEAINIEAPQDPVFGAVLAELLALHALFEPVAVEAGLSYDPLEVTQFRDALNILIVREVQTLALANIDGLAEALADKAPIGHVHFTQITEQTADETPVVLLSIDVPDGGFVSLEGHGDAFVPAFVPPDGDLNPPLPPDGTYFRINVAASRMGDETVRAGVSGFYLHEDRLHPLGLALDAVVNNDTNTLDLIAVGAVGRTVDWTFDYTIRERVSS